MHRLVVVIAVAACSHPAPAAPRHPELARKLDALAAEVIAKTPAAGLTIAVVWHGETVTAKGYGLAEVERRVPATADTVFRIGSITKQLTAAAILRLAAEHRLSLDDELVRHLPDYPVHGRKITLRHLLTHTSGIADYEHGLPWFAEHMAEPRPGAELVAQFAALPFVFEPGTQWAYSNSGYYLLGQIIERISGQPFADYIRDHVLAPAGVTGIRYCPDAQDYPGAAHGYQVEEGKRVPAKPIAMVYAYAAGGHCATMPALVAWSRALAGGRVVDAASWRAMTTPVTLADGSHANYGLGLFSGELGSHRVIFHGGGINGFVSTLAYYPDDDLYVAVAVNTEGRFADQRGEEIARTVLGVPRAKPVDLAIDAAEAAAVAGRYEMIGIPVVLVIEAEGGKLFVHQDGSTERRPLLLQADGSYAVAEPPVQLRFEREAGRATRVRLTQSGVTFEGLRKP